MKLWKRDFLILQGLANNCFSLSQIAERHFPSKMKASRRMKKLFDAGYVSRFPKPTLEIEGRAEYIYKITKKGLRALAMQGIDVNLSLYTEQKRLNAYSIQHILFLNDIGYFFEKTMAEKQDIECKFIYGKRFYPDGLKEHGIEPDAYLLIINRQSKKQLLHFIEIDFGSEMLESGKFGYSFEQKILKYCSYFDSNLCLNDFRDFDFNGKGFRVLVVVKGREHLTRLLQMALEHNAGFFWFCNVDDISEDTILGNIWCYEDKGKQPLLIWSK